MNSSQHFQLYKNSTFPVGCALSLDELTNNQLYNNIATLHFNSVTPENLFKADLLQPRQGDFDFVNADQLVGYCQFHKKRVHGHPLIWHEQLPQWMTAFGGESKNWEEIFTNYIRSVVQHFKGQVTSWDVVNEAFNADGTFRETLWKKKIDNYIAKSFEIAKSANPDALLFYNDFDLESSPLKRRAVLDYLLKLRSEGITVDGIGMQMHINIHDASIEQISQAFTEIADCGFMVHLSEVDISLYSEAKNIKEPTKLFEQQATLLEKIVIQYKALPPKLQYGITFWGISDRDSWIRHNLKRNDHPLLFDENFDAKPAFYKLKEAL